MVNPIQKKMMISKLTEFVTECDNDEALTDFVQNVHHAKLAHKTRLKETGEKVVLVIFNEEAENSYIYKPKELIEEIFDTVESIDIIRNTVHRIKAEIDYKKPVNKLNK